MSATTKQFAADCREDVKYYRSRAVQAKASGLHFSRRTMVELALQARVYARKWASM